MFMPRLSYLAGLIPLAGLVTPVLAQETVLSETFESGLPGGWETNGGEVVSGGNPGNQFKTPYLDWYWIYLRNSQAGSPVIGDLTRHGPLTFAVDIQTYQLNNWNNEPMDPGLFPLVLQFTDALDPTISVYFIGQGMPSQSAGWARYAFQVPDPTSTTLPPGWGGTGDEDPVTFEPRLPPGRTYTSVLRNVGEVQFTTAVPGYFYIPSFWEVGFDNILVATEGSPCYANCDGSTTAPVLTVSDFGCFLNQFAAGNSYANCDGSTTPPILTVADFGCFLNAFAAGCT